MAEDGVATVADLLLRLPFRYEDRSRFEQIARLRVGETAVVSGRVLDSRLIRTRRRGFTILEAAVDDGTGSLRAVWYNRPYLARALTPGRRAILYGAAEAERGGLVFKNPEHELFDADEEGDPVHVGRVVGIYRRTGGLSGKWQRKTVAAALGALAREFASATGAANLRAALQEAHFPSGPDPEAAAEAARRELAREELLVFAAEIEARRARRRAAAVQPWRAGPTEIAAAASHLPFRLTGAQERALAEIAADLSSGHRMARLLQGDVGSGKTAVAFAAAVLAAENGRQAALMAPTEILAEQHAEKMAGWVARSGHRIGLLTGRTRATARRELLAALSRGEIDFLVGTHALVERPVQFADLGLAIIDEQHRFGVAHRARLSRKGRRPHVLVLTATPIPRSLAWTLFGDLDVSRLEEKPPGRSTLCTHVRRADRRARVYAFLGERLAAGERAYVVVPAIEESGLDVAAVEATAREVRAFLPRARVQVLHGRLPDKERRAAMSAFVQGRADVLVATTVVEVGIDVPEATIMVVENAERFGLAQLHQLRGRIGRGSRPSHCVLLTSAEASAGACERVKLLEKTSDGFEIAELDLERRGPGDLLGLRQSGLPQFRVADPFRDRGIVAAVRQEAARRVGRGEGIESDLFPSKGAVVKPA